MNSKVNNFLSKMPWFWPIFIGFLLRIYKITFSSIWHDEGYTMWLLKYDIPGIIERTARDVHPPGYYLFAKPWVEIFGNSEFSIRFLSLLFSVGIIYFVYKIINEVWNQKAAFWSSMFVALSPFMVRFGQEARMYGIVAFFTTAATYYFVKYIKTKKRDWLFIYVPLMIAAMYTQYYAFFVIISHWAIMAVYTKDLFRFRWIQLFKNKEGVFSWEWWIANVLLLFAYIPWFPVAYSQVTRVSDNYWIKPEWITYQTIPNNVMQFILHSHLDKVVAWNKLIGVSLYATIIIPAIFGGLYLFKEKRNRKLAFSMFIFGYLPMLLVFTMSKISTPVYQDRYFPFSAVAIFAIWGVTIVLVKNKYAQYSLMAAIIIALTYGNIIMHQDVDHNMSDLSKMVQTQKTDEDVVLSGELYTFLDGSYYFGDKKVKLISDGVDGYGESSLFYDQQDEYTVTEEEAQNLSNRLWVIGKTGEKSYYRDDLWQGWDKITYFEENKDNGLKAVLYIKN